ncbi:hypothetical protein N7497_006400 [Penicillium chrysogenum]|nr:hypothetical protein N7524_003327 [Penicillium chrysogenum]KAJ6152081.1 hypothetical protein N7497_006400 [Penicillium chrysogenum]
MTESSADAPPPTPPSTHPSKRGKKGPLRKMKAHQKAIKKRRSARITARYNALVEHYLQHLISNTANRGGSAHTEEMRTLCLRVLRDIAVDGDHRDNPSVEPKKKDKQTGDSIA